MADQDWHYLENQFDNSTKRSKKRMKIVALHHYNALTVAPAGIKAALVARITPPKAEFETKYSSWRTLQAQRAGAVQLFEQRLAKLSASDIEDIETGFKNVFKRGSTEHTTVFNGGREPYQAGTADERVSALEELGGRVDDLGEGGLDGVADLIATVLAALKQAQSLVAEKGAGAEFTRTQIEPLRKALAGALYRNLGELMRELGPSEEIAAFFDLEELRKTTADEEEVEPADPTTPTDPAAPVVP